MKKILAIIGFVLFILTLHVVLGFSRNMAFGLLRISCHYRIGYLSNYLANRCSDHHLLAKTSDVALGPNVSTSIYSETNELWIGDTKWEGADKMKRQCVLIADGVVKETDMKQCRGIFVVFEFDKIRYVDFDRNVSGYYRRAKEQPFKP